MTKIDIVIRNGWVIDGTGAERFDADVAIADDRILAVGEVDHTPRAREIDATGLIVAPGFIDVHTHDDRALLSMPNMTPKVSQGVTSLVAGNCGVSLAPLALAALQRFETWMNECLEASRADEDKEADLINDIRFVQSVKKALQQAGVQPAAV